MMPATVETAVLWNEKQASQPQWGHEGRRKSGISPAMFLRRCGSVLHSGGAGGGGVCLGMPVRMMEPGDNTADEPHGGPLPVDAAQLLTNPPNISALSLTHKPTTCDFPTHTANFSAQLPTPTPTNLRPTHLPHDHLRRSQSAALASIPRHLFRLSPLYSIFSYYLHIILLLSAYCFVRIGFSCRGWAESHGPGIGPRRGPARARDWGKEISSGRFLR